MIRDIVFDKNVSGYRVTEYKNYHVDWALLLIHDQIILEKSSNCLQIPNTNAITKFQNLKWIQKSPNIIHPIGFQGRSMIRWWKSRKVWERWFRHYFSFLGGKPRFWDSHSYFWLIVIINFFQSFCSLSQNHHFSARIYGKLLKSMRQNILVRGAGLSKPVLLTEWLLEGKKACCKHDAASTCGIW
jgi:hypothetical protein